MSPIFGARERPHWTTGIVWDTAVQLWMGMSWLFAGRVCK